MYDEFSNNQQPRLEYIGLSFCRSAVGQDSGDTFGEVKSNRVESDTDG